MGAEPYVTITEATFVARFLLDSGMDTAESVENVDVFVDLPDGSAWGMTIFTVDEVRRLLARWKETGEVANGSYFWAIGQLILPEPGVSAMTRAIRELVRSGDIAAVGIRCEAPISARALDDLPHLAFEQALASADETSVVGQEISAKIRPAGFGSATG